MTATLDRVNVRCCYCPKDAPTILVYHGPEYLWSDGICLPCRDHLRRDHSWGGHSVAMVGTA